MTDLPPEPRLPGCPCRYEWRDLGVLGKGWVRMNNDPDCPYHATLEKRLRAIRENGGRHGPAATTRSVLHAGGPMSDKEELVTEAQIDAAMAVLREEMSMPYGADVRDFIAGPDDPPPGLERDAALRALRAADDETDRMNRDLIRRALLAARAATDRLPTDDRKMGQ